jgi:CHAD domain-containing protein
VPGLRKKGSRRLDTALREAQGRLARHFAAIERADPVDVHQGRVASRRVRSLLKTFRTHFRQGPAGTYRRELGRAARRLGPLRDLDVLASQPGMRNRTIAQALAGARRAEVARLRRRLRVGKRWRATVLDGPTSAQLGLDPDLAGDVVERAIRRQWRRVERLLESNPADAGALHALRIRLKNLRYAIEAVADLHDESVAALVGCLRAAQEVLGAERDVACACAWLERSALSPSVTHASLRRLQRRAHVLAANRPGILRELGRAGRRWYRSTR